MSIGVIEPGAFTTIQDLGRPGYRSAGVPPSGAMDAPAMRLANRLVGNADGSAALEVTLTGPTLRFDADAVVALTGAFPVENERGEVGTGGAFAVASGETLRIGRCAAGVRGYVAVRGGIDVPPVLGSRSTFTSGSIGGLRGAPLKAGDYLRIGEAADEPLGHLRSLPPASRRDVVRATPGPQHAAFARAEAESFWSQTYRVSPRSDRAGVRMDGIPLVVGAVTDIDPEGVLFGAVQITSDGLPIVLGPDGPATGGYAKIATVITADLPVIAQSRPGDTVRFVQVDLDEARAAWREAQRALAAAIERSP